MTYNPLVLMGFYYPLVDAGRLHAFFQMLVKNCPNKRIFSW